MIARATNRPLPQGRPEAIRGAAGAKKRFLTKADLREFHQMLLEKRRVLLRDIDLMGEESRDRPSSTADPTDESVDAGPEDLSLDLLEREWTLLGEVNAALERIDKDEYGFCLATGMPIHKARLRACPWARYCIEYAEELEGRRSGRANQSTFEVKRRSEVQPDGGPFDNTPAGN